MASRRSYQDLIAWQKAMDFIDAVYDITESWPAKETYGLTSQVRRSVVSIPANIAEGQGRTGVNEFLHHLSIAYGSLLETETLLIAGRRRRYSADAFHDPAMDLSAEVGRLILALMNSLRRSRNNS